MKNDYPKPPKIRMVHVRLTEETHKRLRIRAAETEMTLQDWVAMAIENELDRQSKRGDTDAER
jgi:predicted HicB family RNase H-like nuclease